MNRKSLIAALTAFIALIAAIIVGLVALYKPSGKSSGGEAKVVASEYAELLKAVPSDAALVICRDSARVRTVESFHNAGSLVSLTVTECQTAPDSSLSPFVYLPERKLLLKSSSETLLSGARRHLEGGYSILDSRGMSEAVSSVSGDCLVFLSHEQVSLLMRSFLKRAFRTDPDFFRTFADWTVFSFRSSKDAVKAEGTSSFQDDPRSYASLLESAPGSDARYADMIPSTAESAFSMHPADIRSYIPLWKKYLDAKGRKEAFSASSERTALELDIKEAAVATFSFGATPVKIGLLRCGKKLSPSGTVIDNPYPGLAAQVFGRLFRIDDDSHAAICGEWLITGPEAVLSAYCDKLLPGKASLSRSLSEAGGPSALAKGSVFSMYFCPTARPSSVHEIFSGSLEAIAAEKLGEALYIPVLLSAGGSVPFSISHEAAWLNPPASQVVLSAKDTVIVPEGPFKVLNGATGKENTFYQNKNMYLCLNDENGKGVWGVPFKTPLCGRVQTIDYYANGKLQFLFASGRSLYLIDRLGRFVGGFPADLGKEVLIGPDVYDFTGAKGYTAVVLHKDNTVGMYNLHGVPSPSWKGVGGLMEDETIKDIPELLEVKGKRYWIVRTGRRAALYPFEGGEPLTKGDGDRMIRPDADFAVSAKGGVSAECYDGKSRDIKL